jgi:chemotaxis family two-component system response regulator Rcp1
MAMLGSLRILLVEDSPGDVRLLQEGLKQGGVACDLRVFGSGKEALAFALGEGEWQNAELPQVIILDLHLPGMDGAEILHCLKSHERTRSIPVIMFSSSAEAADIQRCYDLHANCYIQKPMDLDASFQIMKSLESFWAIVKLANT